MPSDPSSASSSPPPPSGICWRRLDAPGHDVAWLARVGNGWRLWGHAVFVEGGSAYGLSYDVDCDPAWATRSLTVVGHRDGRPIRLVAEARPGGRWRVNGADAPALAGCADVDVGFSPATNTLSIRRAAAAVGGGFDVLAAWLDVSTFELSPLPQTYRRTGPHAYDYASPAHGFRATLTVREDGFVTHYPPLWVPAGA